MRQDTDGSTGWPDIVMYELCDYRSVRTGEVVLRPLSGELPEPCFVQPTGIVDLAPPTDGRPYRMLVKDLDAYQALARSGRLDSPPHRGAGAAVDHRRAPGA